MRSLPDHGDEFWAMFPTDEEGNTIIEEIDLDKYADLEPDPEIAAMVAELERKQAAA